MKANTGSTLVVCAVAILGAIAIIKTNSSGAAQDASSLESQVESGNRASGTITDIINVPGYTYAEVETANGMVWVAATSVSVQVGDTVSFTTGMQMRDFYSNSLEREFEVIYFVDRFLSDDRIIPVDIEAAAAHGRTGGQTAVIPAQEIQKADGGFTIAEIYAQRAELSGKTLRVRGYVVKFTSNVLSTNWVRIRDGSTEEELVITTGENVAINDILLIEGVLELDKNLGQGYVIPAIIEDASISIEQPSGGERS